MPQPYLRAALLTALEQGPATAAELIARLAFQGISSPSDERVREHLRRLAKAGVLSAELCDNPRTPGFRNTKRYTLLPTSEGQFMTDPISDIAAAMAADPAVQARFDALTEAGLGPDSEMSQAIAKLLRTERFCEACLVGHEHVHPAELRAVVTMVCPICARFLGAGAVRQMSLCEPHYQSFCAPDSPMLCPHRVRHQITEPVRIPLSDQAEIREAIGAVLGASTSTAKKESR